MRLNIITRYVYSLFYIYNVVQIAIVSTRPGPGPDFFVE